MKRTRGLIPHLGITLALGISLAQAQIPPQPVADALTALAQQSGLQIIYGSDVVKGVQSKGAPAGLSARDALTKILEGTGLAYESLSDRAVTIVVKDRQGAANHSGSAHEAIRLARAEDAAGDGAESQATSAERGVAEGRLEQIVVTAQKRVELLRDVPVPVTAINGQTLSDNNQYRLEDYFTRVPGLSAWSNGSLFGTTPTIRGITTGAFGYPTVGITIDDMPIGSATTYGAGSFSPDIDPSELTRIEVLRGPQGTLYGASSMGGLIKYVTREPSTDELSGRVQGGISSVQNGDRLGYSMRASVNVPLSDTFALRASGFDRRDAGYIDDPVRSVEGINSRESYGGRLSALWRLSDVSSLKFSALFQEAEGEGYPFVQVQPGLSDLQQSFLRGTGKSRMEYQIYSATLAARPFGADLTAVSGYSINERRVVGDLTPGLGFASELLFDVGGVSVPTDARTTKFTQEIRLSGFLGQKVEWLVGGFYTDEDTTSGPRLLAVDETTGISQGELAAVSAPSTFAEYALFGDVTFHVTDRFDVQLGGRQSRNKQTYQESFGGPLYDLFGGGSIGPRLHSQDSSFTYLLTPRFRISSDLMVYARLASGYRAGAPNTSTPDAVALGVPSGSSPDKTLNYEIGLKGAVLDRALSFDASAYAIDWKNIQLALSQGGIAYFDNGSRARSRGLEVSVEARPASQMTISAWVAYNDAELTENLPLTTSVVGAAGDRLPYSSRLSGSLSIDQEFPLSASMKGFAGGSVSYVGNRKGEFVSAFVPAPRQTLPSYTQLDLRAGLRYDFWTLNLFVNNLADRRGVLAGGPGFLLPNAFQYIQPRTVGLSLARVF